MAGSATPMVSFSSL